MVTEEMSSVLQVATTLDKRWLMDRLRKYCTADLRSLDDPDVNERNLIFALQARKIRVDERFFADLADELGLPFIRGDQIESKSDLAATLPYKVLVENLALPVDWSDGAVKIATANPLNRPFFAMLEKLVRAKVELCVASIEAVERAVGKGYREVHKYRALRDLRYRNPDESAYRVLFPWQRRLIVGVCLLFAVLFIVNYPLSFIVLFAAINLIYFSINPIKFYLSFRGFRGSRRSMRVSDEDLKKLDEKTLPVYTVLIPIYHEEDSLPHSRECLQDRLPAGQARRKDTDGRERHGNNQ